MSKLKILTTATVFVCTALPVFAQQTQNAGLGGIYTDINTAAASGNGLQLGIESINGLLYVSSAGTASAVGTPRSIQVYDPFAGTLSLSYPQDAVHSAVTWGVRDMATDGTVLMGGSAAGITVWDPATGTAATTVQAMAGPQTVTNPITGPGLAAVGTYRALAFDPIGNGGNGSLFTASFGTDFFEIDLAGNVLNIFPNANAELWSAYGCALDPRTNNLLVNSTPNAGAIAEYVIDRSALTMTDTGNRVIVPSQGEGNFGGIQGGLSMFDFGGSQFATSPWPCDTAICYLVQDSFDSARVAALHRLPNVLGYDEAFLTTGVNGAADLQFEKTFTNGDVLTIAHTDPLGTTVGFPTYTVFNIGGSSAGTDGLTFLPFLGIGTQAELRVNNVLSTPNPDAGATILGHAMNGPVGGGSDLTFTVPTGVSLTSNTLMRVQGIHIDITGNSRFNTTNEAVFKYQGGLSVEAVGTNSFNDDANAGFFRVLNFTGVAVTSVVLDITGSGNGPFDTDQADMLDRFDGGDPAGSAAACANTYRNNSALANGLVFAGTIASPCGAFAPTGWNSTTIVGGNATDLSFTFSSFNSGIFEFDCDTDGAGITGGAMAGMTVTVVLAGTTMSGTMVADPFNPLRAFINF